MLLWSKQTHKQTKFNLIFDFSFKLFLKTYEVLVVSWKIIVVKNTNRFYRCFGYETRRFLLTQMNQTSFKKKNQSSLIWKKSYKFKIKFKIFIGNFKIFENIREILDFSNFSELTRLRCFFWNGDFDKKRIEILGFLEILRFDIKNFEGIKLVFSFAEFLLISLGKRVNYIIIELKKKTSLINHWFIYSWNSQFLYIHYCKHIYSQHKFLFPYSFSDNSFFQ